MNNEVSHAAHLAYSCDLPHYPEMFGLQGPEAYAYTSLSNCLDVQDIDDVKEYGDTIV